MVPRLSEASQSKRMAPHCCRRRRRWAIGGSCIILLVSLTLIGCFEDPVEEKVEIELLPNDQLNITATVELLPVTREQNQAAWKRVEHQRALLLEGNDRWTRRFEALKPSSETYQWQKYDGELAGLTRSALIPVDQLSLFFADTALSVFVTGKDDWRELAIYPGASDRATRDQRLFLETRMKQWMQALSSYLRSLESFYGYLEQNEGRSRDLLVHVFQEFVSEDDVDGALLSENEMVLVDDLRDRMSAAWNVLEVGEDAAYSLNEISYVVYDPFPSDLEVILPAEPLEIEGFEREGDRLVVRRTGLWEAFDQLDARWTSPDLLTLWIDAALGSARVDPDQIASLPRVIRDVPSGEHIRSALEESLRPLPRYRVRWRVSPG